MTSLATPCVRAPALTIQYVTQSMNSEEAKAGVAAMQSFMQVRSSRQARHQALCRAPAAIFITRHRPCATQNKEMREKVKALADDPEMKGFVEELKVSLDRRENLGNLRSIGFEGANSIMGMCAPLLMLSYLPTQAKGPQALMKYWWASGSSTARRPAALVHGLSASLADSQCSLPRSCCLSCDAGTIRRC